MPNANTVNVLTEASAAHRIIAATYRTGAALQVAFAQAGHHYERALRATGGTPQGLVQVLKSAQADEIAAASITPDQINAIVALIEAIIAGKTPPTPAPVPTPAPAT